MTKTTNSADPAPISKEEIENETPRVSDISEMQEANEKNTTFQLLAAISRYGDGIKAQQWSLIRKLAAGQIDPETAEVVWVYMPNLPEPHADWPDMEYFVRFPGSDELIRFDELPGGAQRALVEKYER